MNQTTERCAAKAGDLFIRCDPVAGIQYAIAVEDSHDNGNGTQVFWYLPTESENGYSVLGCVKDWRKIGHFQILREEDWRKIGHLSPLNGPDKELKEKLKRKEDELSEVLRNTADALKSMYLNYEIMCKLCMKKEEKADEANI